MTGLGLGIGRGPPDVGAGVFGVEAAAGPTALRGARQPASRRCPVVLDALVAASFLGFIGQMLSADAVQRGRSLFADRAGEGLYVSDVAGLHSGVNPVSGTFSVGATGRLISGGELAEPAREMTIASDLVTM